jgi:hypothetical protein
VKQQPRLRLEPVLAPLRKNALRVPAVLIINSLSLLYYHELRAAAAAFAYGAVVHAGGQTPQVEQ